MIADDAGISFVHVVEVTSEGAVQQGPYLWAVAVPPEEAVKTVRRAVPFGWHVVLAGEQHVAGVRLPVSLRDGQMCRIGRDQSESA